jgi:amidase
MPADRSGDGLPIGMQVVGRAWRDMELLSVARAIARVTGPFVPPPGYGGDTDDARAAGATHVRVRAADDTW